MFGIGTDGRIYMPFSQNLCEMSIITNKGTNWEVRSKPNVLQIAILGDFIYALGSNKAIWKQRLVGMSKDTEWQTAAPGEIVRFTIDEDNRVMYGIGTDKKVYSQVIDSMCPDCEWKHSAPGSVKDIQVYRRVLYAVGADGGIYRQSITCMTPSSQWEQVSVGAMVKIIFYGNHIFGIQKTDQQVYRKHVRHLVPSERNKSWSFFKGGKISTIVASG